MNSFVKSAINIGTTTTTENGDKAFSTSLNACVDLFFQLGAIRGQGAQRVNTLFSAAYGENPDLATRILLWGRDIRGGAGERQSFRHVLEYLVKHDRDRVRRILHLIPVIGRWDDLFSLIGEPELKKEVYGLLWEAVVNENGLAAKWMPRESSSKKAIAYDIMKTLGISERMYRKIIRQATKVVEQQMCANQWDLINYEHVPSVASARYGKAFGRHDQERYAKYLESVKKGEAKVNTGAVYPYDILKKNVDDSLADVMWNNLPDYIKNDEVAFLPIADVSGSMATPAGGKGSVTCMDVAISLCIYLAERNKSAFKGLSITFSDNPALFTIPKGTIREKFNFVRKRNWDMSTNLDAAMQLIVKVAREGNVSQKEMPTHLVIMSDMEFNAGGNWGQPKNSVAERTRALFEASGYKMPNIIWWNIQSRHGTTPVRAGEQGMALVSGFSPSIMTSILSDNVSPEKQMMASVGIERYNH